MISCAHSLLTIKSYDLNLTTKRRYPNVNSSGATSYHIRLNFKHPGSTKRQTLITCADYYANLLSITFHFSNDLKAYLYAFTF